MDTPEQQTTKGTQEKDKQNEGANKNGKSRETGNIGYTRRR
jgi:hypothetical protein